MQMIVQTGLLMLFLGIILITGGTIISILLDIYKKLKLIPKTGYVFICSTTYVIGFILIVIGIMIILVVTSVTN
jgi:hypothetical protein